VIPREGVESFQFGSPRDHHVGGLVIPREGVESGPDEYIYVEHFNEL
jgi:hypothetical protein